MRSESDSQQIDLLRTECERLLDAATGPDQFLTELLALSARHPAVRAATLWLRDDSGSVRLVTDHRLGEFLQGDHLDVDADHQQLLQQTHADGKSRVASDRRMPGVRVPPHALILAGIRRDTQGLGVVEFYADESPGERTLQQLRLMAETLAAHISRFLAQPQERPAALRPRAVAPPTASPALPAAVTAPPALTTPPVATNAQPGQEFWSSLDQLTLQLQRSLDLDEVATVAVNDVRQLLGCDRVALAVQHGPRTIIQAISGQDEVQRRSNQVQALVRLADAVLTSGEPLTYRGDLAGLSPAVEVPLADYLAETRMRMVRLVPLREPSPLPREEDETLLRNAPAPAIIGCLLLEQTAESRPRPGLVEQGDIVAQHVASAIANARRHESIFLLPVWRRLGRAAGWFRGRRVWITAAILAALALTGVLLALIPWEYRVEATGQALPVTRHGVFAPYDSAVAAVLVESNQRVEQGTPLLRLESAELEEQSTRLRGEIAKLEEETYKLRREQDKARREADQTRQQQVYTQYRQARTELDARQAELKIVEAEQQKLTVLSPATGVVTTFQLEQLLRDRPVQRGDLLLEVMDDAGDWRLELDVHEYRMGHLLTALACTESGRLPIDFTPATDSRLELHATLTEVATRSNESEEEGTIVQVYAEVNPDDLPGRRIGAEVDARIRCGQKSLFYCLFGDVVEFVQRKVWW